MWTNVSIVCEWHSRGWSSSFAMASWYSPMVADAPKNGNININTIDFRFCDRLTITRLWNLCDTTPCCHLNPYQERLAPEWVRIPSSLKTHWLHENQIEPEIWIQYLSYKSKIMRLQKNLIMINCHKPSYHKSGINHYELLPKMTEYDWRRFNVKRVASSSNGWTIMVTVYQDDSG